MNSTQVVKNFTETISKQRVPDWGRVMDKNDFPHDYFTNFGAIICNMVSFIFPGFITRPLIKFLANILLPPDIPIDEKSWLTE